MKLASIKSQLNDLIATLWDVETLGESSWQLPTIYLQSRTSQVKSIQCINSIRLVINIAKALYVYGLLSVAALFSNMEPYIAPRKDVYKGSTFEW
jgi:hypothetical protein